MDIKKARAFNSKMGKVQHLSKGGMIRKVAGRKYFDTGGIAKNNTVGGSGTSNIVNNQPNLNNNGIANALGAGSSFKAGTADIQSGTNAKQLEGAYTGANNAINAQIGLTNTLNPQAATAAGNQQALAEQELAMTQGQGPNPAQAALNQATAANTANTTAMMAGQRGASANPALIARMAAQQGAATQQQAVGQSATLQAQQQIEAQKNLQALEATRIGQTGQAINNLNTQQQNEQNILQGANTAYNNAAVGMQSNVNNVNAQTAAANASANAGIIGSIANVIPGVGKMFHAKGGMIDDHLMLAEMNSHSLNHAKKYADGGSVESNLGSPAFNTVASAGSGGPNIEATPQFGAKSGEESGNAFASAVKGLSAAVAPEKSGKNDFNQSGSENTAAQNQTVDDISKAPLFAKPAMDEIPVAYTGGKIQDGPHMSHVANYLAAGGKVPAMVSPGERYLNPKEVKAVVEQGANPMKIGKKILGKPKVKGDSLKNDTVPADLDEGGVVIPRHVTTKNNREKAELFVRRAVHMKNPGGKK